MYCSTDSNHIHSVTNHVSYHDKAIYFIAIAHKLIKRSYLYIFEKKKPYICGRGGYNSWSDGTYHVDALGPTKPQGHTIFFMVQK